MLLTTALLILAASSGETGKWLEECYSNCDRSNKCRKLDEFASERVERCLKFLYDRCEDSNDPFECLNSYKSTRKSGCTKNILKNGIPCLKCEARCDLEKALGYKLPFSGENEKLTECHDKCDASGECQEVFAASATQMNRCKRFTALMCGRSADPIVCLVRLKARENSRCPKAFRKNVLECKKCRETCENKDYGEQDDEEEQCYTECSKTISCAKLDFASDRTLDACEKMTSANCPTNSDLVSCLESIKFIRNPRCPGDFREQVVACLKCDNECTGDSNRTEASPQQNVSTQTGENNCLGKCENTVDCAVVTSASNSRVNACETFVSSHCGVQENYITCLDRLSNKSSANCPVDFRNNLSTCQKCKDECEQTTSENTEMLPQRQICLEACSNGSSCVAMESASVDAIARCETVFVRHCGQYSDIVACMEDYSNEDASCPSTLRINIIQCMKCEQTCDGDSSPSPPQMTRSECEKSCNSSLECSGGVSNACKDCTSAKCEAGDLNCLVNAIAVACREQCSMGGANNIKRSCDNCKAKCSTHAS